MTTLGSAPAMRPSTRIPLHPERGVAHLPASGIETVRGETAQPVRAKPTSPARRATLNPSLSGLEARRENVWHPRPVRHPVGDRLTHGSSPLVILRSSIRNASLASDASCAASGGMSRPCARLRALSATWNRSVLAGASPRRSSTPRTDEMTRVAVVAPLASIIKAARARLGLAPSKARPTDHRATAEKVLATNDRHAGRRAVARR